MSATGSQARQLQRGGSRNEDGEGPSKFVFVDASDAKRMRSTETRRVIHQHAMKEIGKSRRRPKKNSTVVLDLQPLESTTCHVPPSSWWLGLWKWSGGCKPDPFLRYPIELDSNARELVAYVFDDEVGKQRPLRDAWFTVGLQDEAAFIQILSNSALHLEIMRKKKREVRETPDSTRYYTEAIASIRRRVDTATPETLSGIIGAVTGMMAHADILGNDEEWITHHRGLQHLVQLRGGIEQLESNNALRITVSWCELRGVYLLDLRPRFPLPRQWLKYSTPPRSPEFDPAYTKHILHLSRIWTKGGLCHSEWHGLYAELVLFSIQSFQGVPSTEAVAAMPAEFGAWSSPMIHRLLTWRPVDGAATRDAIIAETCRLGALLYLVPAWRFFGVSPVISRVLRRSLKTIVEQHDVDWLDAWTFKLWSLYMGGVEAQESEEEDWFVTQIVATLLDNRVRQWHEAIKHIQDIMWFECLFVGRDDLLVEKVGAMLRQ